MPRTIGGRTYSSSQVGPSINDVVGINPGPSDRSVLWMQQSHRSEMLWNNPQVDTEINFRSLKPWNLDDRVRPYVEQAGFGGPSLVAGIQIDHALLQVLVERWRRETHTFHFRVGEMTVTLGDVAMLLGLRIDGLAVTDDPTTVKLDMKDLCMRLLGVTPSDRDANKIPLTWLKEQFQNHPPIDTSDVVLRRHARAYILYLLGGMLLIDGKGDTVPGMYLPLLENLDMNGAGAYSWASAVLAHLYKGLCYACQTGSKGMPGCAILLQLWSWEHLHLGRPQMIIPNSGGPLGIYWKGPKSFTSSARSSTRAVYRDELDMQQPHQVLWNPYNDSRSSEVPSICVASIALWRSVVPLIHFHEVEWHRPDRVMRQFSYEQHIPAAIEYSEDILHGISRRGYPDTCWSVRHAGMIAIWNQRWERIYEPIAPTELDDYFKWYNSITRHFIIPPTTRAEYAQDEQNFQYQPRGSQQRGLVNGLVEETIFAVRRLQEASTHEGQVAYRQWIQSNERLFEDAGEHDVFTQIMSQFQSVNLDDQSQDTASTSYTQSQIRRRFSRH